MKIVEKNIKDIRPYENNPRKNDEAVQAVANSIKEFGFKVPIVIDGDGVIVCGHTRYKASMQLGLETVPCVIADDLTEEQIKAFRLADNKTNELAEWDMDMLMEELSAIDMDMSEFGFIEEAVDNDFADVQEDNYEVNEDIEYRTKLGDKYLLGDHILMCGDSTKAEDVEKLMGGRKADLLFTDPPYNVNVSNSQGMTIKNDNMGNDTFRKFLSDAFKSASLALKEGGSFYIWHADSETVNFRLACEENGLSIRQCLIWVKNAINPGRQDYKWKHEPCLYGWKEGAAHYFVEEYCHPTVMEDRIEIGKMKKDEMKKLLEEMLSDKVKTTIIHENKPTMNDLHPTMKPLKMCGDLIRNSSRPGEIVLDLFGGSGSTLIACEQLGRQCFMMEYDPKYADVIIDRWETFTGEKAIKL